MKTAESKNPDQPTGADWRQAADLALRDNLGWIAGGLAGLFALLTLALLVGRPASNSIQLWLAGASFLLAAGCFWYFRINKLPARFSHPAAFFLIFLLWANCTAQIYLTGQIYFSASFLLVLIGAGFFLLNTHWFGLVAILVGAGWGVLIWLLPGQADWIYFGGLLLAGALVAFFSHLGQQKLFRTNNLLRLQNNSYKTDLQTVLISTEEAQRSLATSMAVGQRITSILEIDTLLRQVSSLVQQRYNLYAVGIYLYDEQSKELYLNAVTGSRKRPAEESEKQNAIQWVAERRRPLCIDDVTQDDRCQIDSETPDARSELVLPIEFGAQLLGILDLKSTQLARFKEDNIAFMQLVADQVAIAINNATLYQTEKSRRRLTENFYHIGRALSSTLQTNEILELILKHLPDLLAFDRAAVLLLDEQKLHMAAQHGFPPGWQSFEIEAGQSPAFLEILQNQQSLARKNIQDDFGAQEQFLWNQLGDPDQSACWLGVPLSHASEVYGILCLIRLSVQPFSRSDITLVETLAGQAAIAIHNAHLYNQIGKFNQALESLVQQRTLDLQSAYGQLERLDKAKSEFVEMASHELRTPLTVVQGYSQMLLDEPSIKADARQAVLVNGILAGVQRLLEIIESLLDVAKIDSRVLAVYPTPVSLQMLIQSILDRLQKDASDRKISLILDLAGLPAIQGDLDGLRKVFYHLVVNAIKFTPDGGSVTISGRSIAAGAYDFTGPGLEIIVQDTGIGIDPQNHELIFFKFFSPEKIRLHSTGRTKFKGKGPGLGLSIAKGIVEAHRGRIWVESSGCSEGQCPGSQFHVVLPEQQNTEQTLHLK